MSLSKVVDKTTKWQDLSEYNQFVILGLDPGIHSVGLSKTKYCYLAEGIEEWILGSSPLLSGLKL